MMIIPDSCLLYQPFNFEPKKTPSTRNLITAGCDESIPMEQSWLGDLLNDPKVTTGHPREFDMEAAGNPKKVALEAAFPKEMATLGCQAKFEGCTPSTIGM